MTNNNIITNSGRKIIINRSSTNSPSYTAASQYKIGISNSTPAIADTNLAIPIPILSGTVNDNGDNTLTGSGGGDNSTDNSTTYKEGAGLTENKAQNLIANGTSITKTWTIANLATLGAIITATSFIGLWFYIKDATAYAKFLTAGTAVDVRFRTNGDAANKYYQIVKTQANLAVGWNWITGNTTAVNALTQGAGGAPSGTINEFVIIITTNNATDTFVAGDVVYDLLRQWVSTDINKNFDSGYPVIDETNFETEIRGTIASTQANGFNINGFGLFNTDGTVLMSEESTFNAQSKSSTDQFIFITKWRLT